MPYGKPNALTWGFGAVWLGIVLAGTLLMVAYAGTPGKTGAPPESWPGSSQVRRNPHQATLVMFIHPHCPCSRASSCLAAKEMQGTLTAHSEGTGKGATFTLDLPCQPGGRKIMNQTSIVRNSRLVNRGRQSRRNPHEDFRKILRPESDAGHQRV